MGKLDTNIVNLSMPEKIDVLNQRMAQMENRFSDMGYDIRNLVQSEIKSSWRIAPQAETIASLHTAICMETIDPWKQGRVRFFSPLLHDFNAYVKSLPWAWPISSQGGFDDCGCTWVPPAGSKLCILFESGNRNWGYYIGTTWDRDRSKGWGLVVPEYEEIHRGHRGGYLLGENETQVYPPWNTENYNGIDIDSILDFEQDTEAQTKITYPNIYGWKTPQKHMIKMVDGNYKCNFRWQRLEIKSAQGNHLIFKDDRVHPAAQWAHPDCGCGGGDFSKCNDENGQPLEQVDSCPANAFGDNSPAEQKVLMIGGGGGGGGGGGNSGGAGECANPYFKHRSECRPFSGPGTNQNNKVDKNTLPQSGIQLTSLSGHTFWMDDAVENPKGKNNWEKGLEPFDYGCEDLYKGVTVWKAAHGHQIIMSEVEEEPKKRGDQNFIRILTATGNRIELNDHTPSGCKAGPKRGIELQSTSNHIIQMIDENNEQCSPERREGGTPKNEATDAFVKIRTGYGLEIHMGDDNHQKETQQQYIQIMAPQYDACCGPHIIRMQEDVNCGYVFIKAAGDYVCMTEGDHYTIVGVGSTTGDDFCQGGCLGPRNWFTAVSQHSIHFSCNFYFNKAEIHAFIADKLIFLGAGKDCPPPPDAPPDAECGPCFGPVAVIQNGKLKASNRVYASTACQAPLVSIFQLDPFVKPDPPCC